MGYRRPPEHLIREISEEQARILLKDAQNGCDDSREAFIMGFYQTVERYAKKHARDSVKADDLMADGFIAVGNCIEKFDLSRTDRNLTPYVIFSVDNSIKGSELLFGYMDVPEHFKAFIRYHHKVEQELIAELLVQPTDEQIVIRMAEEDESNKSMKEKLKSYWQQLDNYRESLYGLNRVDYDQKRAESYDQDIPLIEEVISIHDEDPYLLEVESDMEIKGIIATIKSGEQYPFESTRHIDYDKLMIEIGENFLDDDERLILYHSYGYLDHEKISAAEINKKLAKPMTLANLSKKKNRIIKRIKNFFC